MVSTGLFFQKKGKESFYANNSSVICNSNSNAVCCRDNGFGMCNPSFFGFEMTIVLTMFFFSSSIQADSSPLGAFLSPFNGSP